MKQNRFYTVQALRALAALLVVTNHAFTIANNRLGNSGWNFHAGAAGVDLFFCISGFVIVTSSIDSSEQRGSWAPFLWRRIVRIVPLYWLAITLKLVVLIAVSGLAQHSVITPWHTFASFLFIPAWNSDHQPLPVLPQGWTLSFEILFYALFAAVLAFRPKPVGWLTSILVVLSIVGLLRTKEWGAVATLLNPLLLEFSFGMWIAVIISRGYRLPLRVAQYCIIILPILLVASNALPEGTCVRFGVLLRGAPAALLLWAAVSLENRWGKQLSGLPNSLGDASYAIYLFHGFLVQAVAIILLKLHAHGSIGIACMLVISLLSSCIAGVIIHRWIELPLIKQLRQLNLFWSHSAQQKAQFRGSDFNSVTPAL